MKVTLIASNSWSLRGLIYEVAANDYTLRLIRCAAAIVCATLATLPIVLFRRTRFTTDGSSQDPGD